MPNVSYSPPGPVIEAFHQDQSFIRGVLGPVGSGKSSGMCGEIFSRALEQRPNPQGVRRSRWGVIRNTYPELKTTTIKTWLDWYGEVTVMKWDSPITAMVKLGDLGDGTSLELEVVFLALDRPEDVGKLKSLELTGAWLNEASELEKPILDVCTQRVGRFPSQREGGPSWYGVIMDTNPPDEDSWWYDLAEEKRPENHRFFQQPGGLYEDKDSKSPTFGQYLPNPAAENIPNLPGGYEYYLKQLPGKDTKYIRVYLCGLYGTTLDGKAVYPEYNEKIHLSPKALSAIRGVPIIEAYDFGLTPAVAFLQLLPTGQLACLGELTSENMAIRQFYSEAVLPYKQERFAGFRFDSVGDPAGQQRVQTDAVTPFMELERMGVAIEAPCENNAFIPRRDAVAFWLTQLTSAGPGFLLDPSCKVLRKGFNGMYLYERVKVSGAARFKDQPAKNKYSHVHDALQYGAMRARPQPNQHRNVTVQRKSMRGWT